MIRKEDGMKARKQLKANAQREQEKVVVTAEKKARWDKPIIKLCDFNELITEFLEVGAEEITKKPSKSTLLNEAKAALQQRVELLALC